MELLQRCQNWKGYICLKKNRVGRLRWTSPVTEFAVAEPVKASK